MLASLRVDTVAKIAGILNVAPDSFSDGGRWQTAEEVAARITELRQAGAALVDIGAQSTRPGATFVSESEEISRLEHSLRGIKLDAGISIDTFHAGVAAWALERGAGVINDVSAGRYDVRMLPLIAESEAYCILMYSQQDARHPHAERTPKQYVDVIADIREFLLRRVDAALAAGIKQSAIILDPGFGAFISSEPEYSFEVVRRFVELTEGLREFPLLIGVSRKGFLSSYAGDRDSLSQFLEALCVERGASYVRTHNVAQCASVLALRARVACADATRHVIPKRIS